MEIKTAGGGDGERRKQACAVKEKTVKCNYHNNYAIFFTSFAI